MIIQGILYMLIWPIVIVVSFLLIRYAIKHFESKHDNK